MNEWMNEWMNEVLMIVVSVIVSFRFIIIDLIIRKIKQNIFIKTY